MDIASGIAAVTQGLSIAKALRSIEKTYDEATAKAKIAEIIDALTDAKLALAEAKEGLADRDREIERLRAAFAAQGKLVTGPGDYMYKSDAEGRPLGYPTCPKCQAVDGRIVQLKQNIHYHTGQFPVCESSFRPVTAILHYTGDTPYTKDNEYSDAMAEANRKMVEHRRRITNSMY
jgi:hypothetical protein